jgi:phosphatidylglycerol---prolipoprotein diacylglyceryl transferase
MYPRLLELGPLTIYSYGLLLAAGYLAGLQFALVRARQRGLDADRVMGLGIWIIFSALIGAKLMLLLVEYDQFARDPRQLLSLAQSGGVFYGGLITAVAVAFWYMRRHRMHVWATCDAFAPGIALGHVIGRLGCFLAGCCYGRSSSVPWAVTFTDPFAAEKVGTPLHVELHPTQLYESGAEALILVGLLALERRGRAFPGRTFWTYLLLYGATRFVIEMFRGDPRGMIGVLSTAQFISVVLVTVSLYMLWRLSRQEPEPIPTSRRAQARAA